MLRSSCEVGRRGETAVVQFLEKRQWTIFYRNWRTPFGEIDIIAKKGNQILVCEVKTRNRNVPSRPLLGFQQKKRLQKAALWVWQQNRSSKVSTYLVAVTSCDMKWIKLPLLYDKN